MRSLFRVLVCLLAGASGLIAQTDARPQFEVASIKPAAPDARGMGVRFSPGGRVNITNMPLKELIVIAWRIQPFQISGGPPWLESAHFDISAKPETKPKQSELPLLLQSLLEDRFQLAFHRENKEMPIYGLVLARKDGKLGPNLVESKEGTCTQPDPTRPPPPPAPGQPPPRICGGMMMGLSRLNAVGVPVANLAPMLSRMLGRTVVDQTGLTGKFDISMEWVPDETQALQLPPDAPRPPPPSDPSGPSLFTALHEQLGLKLESQKGPVEMFVIERAEKPSEN
jgi:uncharacterized protein (TIGR03435 family)